MKKLPQISEAEYEVMKVIWEAAPVSTNEVTDKLHQSTDWSPNSIQTLLKRLVQKGAVSYRKESSVFVYTPLVKQTEYLEHENSHFLQRFYNGNFASMLTSYLDNDSFTEKELDELRELLKQREGGSR